MDRGAWWATVHWVTESDATEWLTRSHLMTPQVALVVKNPLANAGDTKDMILGLIPGLGRSPGGGNGTPLQCSCLEKIPWTEEPGGLHSMGPQSVGPIWATRHTQSSEGLTGDGGGAFKTAHSYSSWLVASVSCHMDLSRRSCLWPGSYHPPEPDKSKKEATVPFLN